MTPGEFPIWSGRIADGLQARAAAAAANAMAIEFQRELVGVTLRKSSHKAGTDTPSKPGEPPALVTGTMRRSARIIPAVSAGPRAVAAVRVGVIYARIQEKGGVVVVKRARILANKRTGQFFGPRVTIPRRPYMQPTRDLLLASGRFRARANQAIAAIAREAASG